MKFNFHHEAFMSLRTSTDYEIRLDSPPQGPRLNSSFPRRRESRFIHRRISLDARFRGYDGTLGSLFVTENYPRISFFEGDTKRTKFGRFISETFVSGACPERSRRVPSW